MPIDLAPLFEMRLDLAEPLTLEGTPAGTRVIFEVTGGRVEGERVRAGIRPASGDWVLVGPDGTGMLDSRLTAETDDGALIYMQANGRADLSAGPGGGPIYAAPRFETGDPRYAWLNRVQGLARVELAGSSVTYEVYEAV